MATNPNVAHLSAHPSYLRPIDPEREANRQQRSKAGSAARSAQKEQCPNCLRMFSLNGIARHKSKCVEGEKRYVVSRGPAHNKCEIEGCARIKPMNALRCFLHEDKSNDLIELDRLCRAGITTPRRKL